MSAARSVITGTLKSKLVNLIRLRGPLTVADYMKIVLTNPSSGFYMNDDVFGVKGHFTTNPEISQIFGEILGAWIIQEWRRFSCPKPLRLVEFGPGRGTLMLDITRTICKLEKSSDFMQLKMIEMSPKLRDIQKQTISNLSINISENTQWITHIDALTESETNDGFTAFIAHEFLDALPIHKFVRDPGNNNRWRELFIDYDQNQNLRFCIGRQPSLSTRLLVPEDFPGSHLEVCPESALCLEKVAKHLNRTHNGCMLICDYGFEDPEYGLDDRGQTSQETEKKLSNRDTFRAFKNHQSWPPLTDPGEADLTADVDFGYLKRSLNDKAIIFGSVNQRNFLNKCGLQVRLERLLDRSNDAEKLELMSGANMITNDMGERYRFLSIFPKQSKHLFDGDPPAGFCEVDYM